MWSEPYHKTATAYAISWTAESHRKTLSYMFVHTYICLHCINHKLTKYLMLSHYMYTHLLFTVVYQTIVTVYAKTVPIGTTIEIHFMA